MAFRAGDLISLASESHVGQREGVGAVLPGRSLIHALHP